MKKLNKLIVLLVCLLLVSGCVKNTNTMTIDNNKKMTYETEILISDSLDLKIEDFINNEELKSRKFTINTSKYDGYTGVTISKEFKNIDKLSTDKSIEKVMSNFLNKDFSEKELFKRDKGFFKDTYTAKFKYTINESDYKKLVDDLNKKKEEEKEKTTNQETVENTTNDVEQTTDETITNTDASDEEDLSELNKMAELESEMELLFKLKVPYECTSNNATDVSDDGKVLTWKLDSNGDTAVSFTFYLLNWTHILIVGGICLVVLVGLIIFVMMLRKKKSSEPTLIHIDYDQSIASKVENEVVNNSGDLDVQLSTDETNKPVEEEKTEEQK